MRRVAIGLIVWLVLIGSGLTAAAQDGSGRPAITRENIDQVVELARWGRGTISKLAWSPDGETLAVMGDIGVWLYDADDLSAEPRLLEGHTEHLLDLAYSPDGSLIATGSADHTARVWDVASGETVLTLEFEVWVRAVAFSPDGATLATSGDHPRVHLFDVSTGADLRVSSDEFCYHTPVDLAFSPDGTLLACASDTIYSDAPRGRIAWWNLETDTVTRGEYTSSPAYAVAFSPDGAWLASSQEVWGYDEAPQAPVVVWDVASGELATQWFDVFSGRGSVTGTTLAFNHTGDLLASTGRDGVQLLDASRAIEVQRLHTGHEVSAAAFSPVDDRLAYVSENVLVVRDLVTGTEQMVQHESSIMRVAFLPDGERVVVGRINGSVELWNIVTGQLERVLLSPGAGGVVRMAVSPDGSLLAISLLRADYLLFSMLGGSYDASGRVLLLDTATGRELWQLDVEDVQFMPDVAFTHDGRALLYSCDPEDGYLVDREPVRALDVTTLESRILSDQMRQCTTQIVTDPDGPGVIMMDGVRFMVFEAGVDGGGVPWRYEPDTTIGNEHLVTSLAWHADSDTMALAEYRPAHGGGWSEIYVWRGWGASPIQLEDVNLRGDTENVSRDVYQIAFSGNGSLLLAAGAGHYGAQGDVYVWDMTTRALNTTLHGHHRASTSLAVSPDDSLIVTGGADGTLRVWGVP